MTDDEQDRGLDFEICTFRWSNGDLEIAIGDGLQEWTACLNKEEYEQLRKWLASTPREIICRECGESFWWVSRSARPPVVCSDKCRTEYKRAATRIRVREWRARKK